MTQYEKLNFVNGSPPALNAATLNHMEDGIAAATDGVTALDETVKNKPDFDDVYTVEEADDHFLSKYDAGNTYATKAELVTKADKATTLAGYGITDAYTKTEVGTALAKKADKEITYTKTEVDTKLSGKLNNTAGSVTTDNIASKAVTAEKLGEDVTNQLSKLKGDLDKLNPIVKRSEIDLKYHSISGNLVDAKTCIENKYLLEDGTIADAPSQFAVTDFFPIYKNDMFLHHDGSDALVGYCVYDESFDLIRAYKGHSYNYTYVDGDYYIRMMTRNISSVRAFWGNEDLGYNDFVYDNRKDTKDISENKSNVNVLLQDNAVIKKEISNLNDALKAQQTIGNVILQTFEDRVSVSSNNTFSGFASRYSCFGSVYAIDINGAFSSESGNDAPFEIAFYDGTFSNVIAAKTISVKNGTKSLQVTFDENVFLNGDFYIAIKATTTDGHFRVNNLTSPKSAETAEYKNKYIPSSLFPKWGPTVGDGYNVDIILYEPKTQINVSKPSNIIYVGKQAGCDYEEVQDALDSIKDDSETNPYTLIVMEGAYKPFTMCYEDGRRLKRRTSARWVSIIGLDVTKTIFFDNKGNYMESPCEIWTNGVIKNLTFVDKTDAEHHTQAEGRTIAYAVHSDFGTCKTRYENCVMYSNAGPAIGIGTWYDEVLEFYNCRFESDCDGTFGTMGHGAFFCHTQSVTGHDTTNQRLIMHDCIAIANYQVYGGRLAVIAGYEGTYEYELQNVGFFGRNGANVSLQAPDNDLLSRFNFNNVPSILNTVS